MSFYDITDKTHRNNIKGFAAQYEMVSGIEDAQERAELVGVINECIVRFANEVGIDSTKMINDVLSEVVNN